MKLFLKLFTILAFTAPVTLTLSACSTDKTPTPPFPPVSMYQIKIGSITKISLWALSTTDNGIAIKFFKSNTENITGDDKDETFWFNHRFFYGVTKDPSIITFIEQKLKLKIDKFIINLSLDITNVVLGYNNYLGDHHISILNFK